MDLEIINGFITKEQEQEILTNIPVGEKKNKKERNNIIRYGSNIPYKNNVISVEIPEYLAKFSQLIDFDSVTINEYFPKQEIAYHVDSKQSGEIITVLSLLGEARMNFRQGSKGFHITLLPRTLIKLQGDLRWNWEHSISHINTQRYSLVFRKSQK